MGWIYLALAAVFEIIFALSMKASEGFTKPLASGITAVAVIGGIGCLTLALRFLPVSIAYPIWTGVGTLGTVIFGFLYFNEPLSAVKLASVAAIILGVAGLKVAAA